MTFTSPTSLAGSLKLTLLWKRSQAASTMTNPKCGPLVSAVLTALPTREQRVPVALVSKVAPTSHRTCRCGRQLDVYGAVFGWPNVFVRDMDLATFNAEA